MGASFIQGASLAASAGLVPVALLALSAGHADFACLCAAAMLYLIGVCLGATAYGRLHRGAVA